MVEPETGFIERIDQEEGKPKWMTWCAAHVPRGIGSDDSSSQKTQFLQQIVADPSDDVIRLVYADWLDEQGDPQGELIRIQCELAKLDFFQDFFVEEIRPRMEALWKRESELIEQYDEVWAQELPGCLTGRRYERGCVEGVVVSVDAFLSFGEDIFRAAPIRFVQLTDFGKRTNQLVDSALLGKIRFLRVQGGRNDFQKSKWDELLGSEQLANLVGLDLSRNFFPPLYCISRAESLSNLKILGLDNCGLRDADIPTLIRWPGLEQIEELYLRGNAIGDEGVRALMNSEAIRNLKILDLSRNQLTGDAGYAIASSKHAENLAHLDLSRNPDFRSGANALEKAKTLNSLISLHVRNCKISRDDIAGLSFRFENQLERGRWQSELTRKVAGLFCSQRYQPRRWHNGISNGVPRG